jgi:hypothetical protein
MMVRGTTDRNKHNDHERVETQPPNIRDAVHRLH